MGHLDVSSDQAQLSNVQQVARGVLAQPVWRPDGQALAYVALSRAGAQVWFVAIAQTGDGAETFTPPRQITNGPTVDATSRSIWLSQERAVAIQQWLRCLGDSTTSS